MDSRIFPVLFRLSHPLYREERALTPHVPGFWIRQGLFETFIRSFLPFLAVFPYVLFWLYLLFHGYGFIQFLLDFLTIFFGAIVLTPAGVTDCLARMARPGSRIGVAPAIVIWIAFLAGLGFLIWREKRINPNTYLFLGLPAVVIAGLPFLLVRWKQACGSYFKFEKEMEEEFEDGEEIDNDEAVSKPDGN